MPVWLNWLSPFWIAGVVELMIEATVALIAGTLCYVFCIRPVANLVCFYTLWCHSW